MTGLDWLGSKISLSIVKVLHALNYHHIEKITDANFQGDRTGSPLIKPTFPPFSGGNENNQGNGNGGSLQGNNDGNGVGQNNNGNWGGNSGMTKVPFTAPTSSPFFNQGNENGGGQNNNGDNGGGYNAGGTRTPFTYPTSLPLLPRSGGVRTKSPVDLPTNKPVPVRPPVNQPSIRPVPVRLPVNQPSIRPAPVTLPVNQPSIKPVGTPPKSLLPVTIATSTSSSPVSRAVNDPLCCAATSYGSSNWRSCAAGTSTSQTADCSQCIAYQCIDWTAGSVGMKNREATYTSRTGDTVYFGVGSYGNDQTRAGKCYRISATNLDRDLIVQSINQGADVPNANFDLQVGDGGFGLNNACTVGTTSTPQFDGAASQWGAIYGGWTDITGCDNLPQYPHCGSNPQDNMRDLCKWSFNKVFRKPGAVLVSNPVISKMCEVKCPVELYTATGIHRSDEINSAYTCGTNLIPTGGVITRMMDCSKPSYAWVGNVKGTTYTGFEAVIPCRRDGYTRVNQ